MLLRLVQLLGAFYCSNYNYDSRIDMLNNNHSSTHSINTICSKLKNIDNLYKINIGVAKPGHTRAAARASPIFAPASASYLDF